MEHPLCARYLSRCWDRAMNKTKTLLSWCFHFRVGWQTINEWARKYIMSGGYKFYKEKENKAKEQSDESYFSGLIIFEQKPEWKEGRSRYLEPDRGKSMCQGPEQDCLADLKYSKEAGMTGAGWASGRVVGDGVRQKAKELYSEMESPGGLQEKRRMSPSDLILIGGCWLWRAWAEAGRPIRRLLQ